MRTRSAARGAGAVDIAATKTVDMFPSGPPPTPKNSGTGLKFYKCSCDLVQVWGSGACIACKKSLVGCPQVAERDVPVSQDVSRVGRGVSGTLIEGASTVDPAKLSSARDKIAAVFGSVAPRATNGEGPLTSRATRAEPPKLLLETDLGALCTALEKRGVVQRKSAKPLTLAMVARWTTEQRHDAAMWCERMAGRPPFLENGVDDERDEHDDQVVVDEEGDARTRAEMREKHAIDASAPEMREVLEPATKAESRRRIVRGEASKSEVPKDSMVVTVEKLTPADVLTVTWGEEKFTPIPGSYSTCSIGPFTVTVSVMPGQSNVDAWRDANEFLSSLARDEKDRKLREFTAQLQDMMAKVRR